MYTVTFYSFKGGVGRTMAMVNVAHDLVDRGKKVLIVDFDLEAPGADTFDFDVNVSNRLGLVDYVHDFIHTNRAKPVTPYVHQVIYRTPAGGELWLMPSGRDDGAYGTRLSEIDWGDLYENRDGYLLFENLKAQFSSEIRPDYVLIDSRTGHTDVGGICTRQLPDAVVVLFFPNVQNLRGLKKVVQDIRREAYPPRRKGIRLHFALSNVPDLDDEEQILGTRIQGFCSELTLDNPPHIIHRYDSLELLNQVVFVRERPRSRLAREYRELTDRIIRSNPEDREGVIQYLSGVRSGNPDLAAGLDDFRNEIQDHFRNDGEIQFHLAMTHRAQGQPDLALDHLTRALNLGYNTAAVFLARADQTRDVLQMYSDLLRALETADITSEESKRALMQIRLFPSWDLQHITQTIGWNSLTIYDRSALALRWRNDLKELRATVALLEPVLAADEVGESPGNIRHLLAFAHIGLGELDRAIELLSRTKPLRTSELSPATVADLFNHSMALWCRDGVIQREWLEQIVEFVTQLPEMSGSANVCQCMAIAYHLLGDSARAIASLESARKLLDTRETSCWRYLHVSSDEFLKDLVSIRMLIDGQISVPHFVVTHDRQ